MANGLGKGLSALFSDTQDAYAQGGEGTGGNVVAELPLDKIFANPDQPRKEFDERALSDLAASIREHGVIVPILVLPQADGRYMIVAGERRYRASRLAGKTTIPAVIKEYTPEQAEEIALIENLQREALDPMESAWAMRRLMEEYRLTQEELARRIGKSRPAIANALRLLSLQSEAAEYLRKGKITQGHARALLVLPEAEQAEFAHRIVREGLSVRRVERLVRERIAPKETLKKKRAENAARQAVELKELVDTARRVFGTKVSLIGSDKKGRLYVDYYTRDDLERIFELLRSLENK